MSKWVLVFLCLSAPNAFASSADSGRCPWKIPFTIVIHAHGFQHDHGSLLGDTTYFTTLTYVDTMHSFPFSVPDTMLFGVSDNLLEFDFAPKTDSILTIQLSQVFENHQTYQDQSLDGVTRFLFKIESLQFDDTSIFSSDSEFLSHSISYNYYDSGALYYNGVYQGNFVHNFTASSVDLSGIFRPMHFADQASVSVAPQVSSNSIALYPNPAASKLTIQFAPREEDMQIKFFDNLGIARKSFSAGPGSSSAELDVSDLPNGFYTLALGQDRQRVVVLH